MKWQATNLLYTASFVLEHCPASPEQTAAVIAISEARETIAAIPEISPESWEHPRPYSKEKP